VSLQKRMPHTHNEPDAVRIMKVYEHRLVPRWNTSAKTNVSHHDLRKLHRCQRRAQQASTCSSANRSHPCSLKVGVALVPSPFINKARSHALIKSQFLPIVGVLRFYNALLEACSSSLETRDTCQLTQTCKSPHQMHSTPPP